MPTHPVSIPSSSHLQCMSSVRLRWMWYKVMGNKFIIQIYGFPCTSSRSDDGMEWRVALVLLCRWASTRVNCVWDGWKEESFHPVESHFNSKEHTRGCLSSCLPASIGNPFHGERWSLYYPGRRTSVCQEIQNASWFCFLFLELYFSWERDFT